MTHVCACVYIYMYACVVLLYVYICYMLIVFYILFVSVDYFLLLKKIGASVIVQVRSDAGLSDC